VSVAAAKIATLVRCVERARAERAEAGSGFQTDFTRQDAAILNVRRACETAVDLANMVIRKQRLGLPGEMKESFLLLERSRLISAELSDHLPGMIGFRNIAVHQYKKLDLDIFEAVIDDGLDDLFEFAESIRTYLIDGSDDFGSTSKM